MNDDYLTSPIDLSTLDLDDAYEIQETTEDSGQPVPDGKYQVTVDGLEVTQSKAGAPMIKWTLKIIGPTYRGRYLWRYVVIKRDNLRWIKNDLTRAGLILKKFSDLSNHLHKLLDVRLEITKRTQGDYENIYINSLIHSGDESAYIDEFEDDIPF